MTYKLSAELNAHTSDVRAVASPNDTLVLSASRDKTAIAWTRPASGDSFQQEFTFHAGEKFINAVAYIPPLADAPRGYMVTGGAETVINVYPLDSPSNEPKYALIGHRDNVCTLNASPSGLIISGSWDKSAKVWRDFQELYELRGHEQSVWAVQILDEDEENYLTASADRTIKLWKRNKAIRTFNGHQDAVRGLALIPHIGFASCSNDGEVRVWTIEGDIISVLSGHTSFVYSLTVLPGGEIASGGEDRSLRIWRDEECIQTIVHPATSVWSVSSMPNGDIVTGASDGVVRIFSASEERWASAEVLKKFDEVVANQALPSQQIGDVKKSDLPGTEALFTPGKKPGEVKMVRNGDKVEAHQWDSGSMSWQKIGEVVDAVGSGRKQLYNGKEYDYVFDVDIQDGVPTLKLPYNASENPYAAAQRFLASNDLPMSHLDEVVRFIEKNTSGVNLSQGSEYSDPFTGSSRYQASSSSVPAGGSGYVDPFTGGSRYQPQQTATPSTSSNIGDPLTGGSRYTPPVSSSTSAAASSSLIVLPVTTFLSFKQGSVSAMRGKVLELDDAFRNEISTVGIATYTPEATKLDEAYTFLYSALSSGSQPPTKVRALDKSHLETIEQLLDRWPNSSRFPLIDLARLICGYCPAAYSDPKVASQFFNSLLRAAEWDEEWETPMPKQRQTNILLALRSLANAFSDKVVRSDWQEWAGTVFSELEKAPYEMLAANHKVTLATLLFNASCVRMKVPSVSSAINDQHLGLISKVLRKERSDAETIYRSLVALGNILFTAKSQGIQLKPSQTSEIRDQIIPSLRTTFPEERVKTVISDIETLLASL